MPACATPNFVEGCDRSSSLPLMAHGGMRSGRQRICIKKAFSFINTFNTDLNDDNLSNPTLTIFLASDQLRLPKHGHGKFVPKQLGLRERLPTDLVSQDSCKVVA